MQIKSVNEMDTTSAAFLFNGMLQPQEKTTNKIVHSELVELKLAD